MNLLNFRYYKFNGITSFLSFDFIAVLFLLFRNMKIIIWSVTLISRNFVDKLFLFFEHEIQFLVKRLIEPSVEIINLKNVFK